RQKSIGESAKRSAHRAECSIPAKWKPTDRYSQSAPSCHELTFTIEPLGEEHNGQRADQAKNQADCRHQDGMTGSHTYGIVERSEISQPDQHWNQEKN